MSAENQSAPRQSVVNGLIEHIALRALAKLNTNATGELRVALSGTSTLGSVSGGTISTVTTVAAVTQVQSYGAMTQAATMQQLTQQQFQSSYRRNLVSS